MKKSKLFLFSLLIVIAVVSCTKSPEGGFAPLLGPGLNNVTVAYANNGGNVTCDEVLVTVRQQCSDPNFVFAHTSGRIDYSGGGGGTVGPITWTTNGTYINWTSTTPVKIAIIVKGGPNANVYFSGCGDCVSSGTALSAPINPNNGRPYGLSNITFCWNECTPTIPKVVAFKGFLKDGRHIVSDGNLLFNIPNADKWCEPMGYNAPSTTFNIVVAPPDAFKIIGTASVSPAGVITIISLTEGVLDEIYTFVGTVAELQASAVFTGTYGCPNYGLWPVTNY